MHACDSALGQARADSLGRRAKAISLQPRKDFTSRFPSPQWFAMSDYRRPLSSVPTYLQLWGYKEDADGTHY